MARPKIRACSICDPYVLVFREDDTIGLFIDTEKGGKIRRKDMSPMGDKVRANTSPCHTLTDYGFPPVFSIYRRLFLHRYQWDL